MSEPTLAMMQEQLQAQFPERLVTLPDGAQIAWREAGDTSSDFALVMLHGISSGAASWLGVAQDLQQLHPGVRVLAWDAPGYGASTPLAAAAPSDADYAARVQQSLTALGVQRCVLVGHSLGALMAARLAVDMPALVQQLVLISPAGGYGAPAKAEQQAKVRASRLESLAQKGVAGLAAVIDQRLVSEHGSEVVRQWVRWNTQRMHAAGYAQAVELLCSSDLGRASGRLSMPLEVWVGEHDVVTKPEACEAWAKLLGARTYRTLAAAGHASPVEQPGEIAQRLAGLLNPS